jgi:pyruvate dehydrogenase E1 component beta subunit
MFGEQCVVPMTLRAPDGITKSAGSQHSQALESWFMHTPGLEVVVPADPEDAKGLLKAAIRSDNPTLYFEHKALFPQKGAVPDDDDFVVPLGKAKTMRGGNDALIVTYGVTVGRAMDAAKQLEADGIDVTVLNMRTIWPLDYGAIADAVARTHRVIVAHEAVRVGGVGAEIASWIGEHCFDDLDGPVVRLGAAHVPVPFAPVLQEAMYPKAPMIADATRRLVRREL